VVKPVDDSQQQGWRSRYDGPKRRSTFQFGGRSLCIEHPADPERLLNDPEILARNAQDDYMPYWAFLWPGAFLLAEAVQVERWDGDEVALEIGCGLGLAGLAALQAGVGKVVFTDYDEAPLTFIAASAAANEIAADRLALRRLDWRELPDERYDRILGADVLYERGLVPLVSRLIHRMLAPGGYALVAGPYRVATEDLGGILAEFGLRSESRPVASVDERGTPVRGTAHRIWR
jgi:predicted nicotinamide N-methyase